MPPTPAGIPMPKIQGRGFATTPANSNINDPALQASYQNMTNTLTPMALGFNPGTPTGTPGMTTSPGHTYTLQDILAGNAPGVGASVSTAPAGYSAPAGWSATAPVYTPDPTQTTNLGAYGVSPDQYSNPTPNPGLSYLGLPNYGGSSGGDNSDNGFAGLFGANTQTNFLSGWN